MENDRKRAIKQRLKASRTEMLDTLANLTEAQWEATVYSEQATWRVADLLGHVLYAEQGMTQLIERIRAGESGVPEDFDLARWNDRGFKMYKDRTPAELFAALTESRNRLLELVDDLQDNDWSKEGRHGSLNIMTIDQILKTIAIHERQHVRDISQALSL